MIVGGIAALLFATLTPPLGNPDEGNHLARSYLASEGHFGVPGRAPHARLTMPRSFVTLARRLAHTNFRRSPRKFQPDEIRRLFSQPLAPDARVRTGHLGAYGPVCYVPQALAMLPGRLAGASPVALVYMGRLGNVVVYLLAGWLALRLVPTRRLALAIVLLMPMSVAQAASLSADVPTNALAVVFTALCWRLALAPGAEVTRRDAVALVGVAALLALTKAGYWLLVGQCALIPIARFGSVARQRRIFALTAAAVLVPSLLWLAGAIAADPAPGSPHQDMQGQVAHLIDQPWSYFATLGRSLWPNVSMAFVTGIGVLGNLNVMLPTLVYVLVPIALGVATLTDDPDPPELTRWKRAMLLALFAGTAVVLLTLALVAWNPVGVRVIVGVQGRYYLPLVPLVVLAVPALPARWQLRSRARVRVLCIVASAVALALGLHAMLVAFYA